MSNQIYAKQLQVFIWLICVNVFEQSQKKKHNFFSLSILSVVLRLTRARHQFYSLFFAHFNKLNREKDTPNFYFGANSIRLIFLLKN